MQDHNVNCNHIMSYIKFKHTYEINALDNRITNLIYSIIMNYLEIRYKYFAKFLEKFKSDRRLYTKLILFKGQ
jgi:hypothetical protein